MGMSSEHGSQRCPCGSYDQKIILTVRWEVQGLAVGSRSDRQVFCGKEHFAEFLHSGTAKGYWKTAYSYSLKMWHARDYWWEMFQAEKAEDFDEFLKEEQTINQQKGES